MKKLVKEFLSRGLICGGFGPLVYGIIMFILYLCGVDINIDGLILFKGIISTYLMAFFIAGFSVIWQVERLGLAISILIHGSVLYICYLVTYLINGWLDTNIISILVFSFVFVLGYLLIWLVIYLVEKNRVKDLNMQLKINK